MVVPAVCAPCISSAWASIYGAAATTPGSFSAWAWSWRQSVRLPFSPVSVACEVTLRIRVLSSRSNPFMTDSTTISTATPTASPSAETTEMNDRKPRPRVERR